MTSKMLISDFQTILYSYIRTYQHSRGHDLTKIMRFDGIFIIYFQKIFAKHACEIVLQNYLLVDSFRTKVVPD